MIRYARDRMGRMLGAVLEEASGQRVETWFERDAFGRIVRERQGDRAIRYAYGERGLRAERVMPDGARTRYAYDALDALVAVDHDGHRVAFERDALGREIQRASGEAGVAVRSAYDAMDRLIEQRATAPGPGVPSVMVARQWHYDARGRVDRVDDARWGATTYLYDRASRLASAQRGAGREVFAYDPAGSIRGMLTEIAERSSASRVAEAPHQGRTQPTWRVERGGVLRKTEQAAYDVDARGRRTVKVDLARHRANRPEGGSPAEEATTRYTWDCRDRLREVRTPDGARVVMTYDAFGRRVRKEVTATTAAGRPRVVEFVWDGDVLAADIDSERGGRTFVHAPGTFVPLLQQQDGRVLTYVNDHLGTPKELLDPRGLVAWAAAHSAWGKIVEVRRDPLSELSHRTSVESPFRLLGQYADEETGLCYTRFRFFDPETGGWCSPDPIRLLGGLNLFAWEGDPANTADPLGLAPLCDKAKERANKVREKIMSDMKSPDKKPRTNAGSHAHFDEHTTKDILANPDAVYMSQGKSGRMIFRKGDNIVVVDGPGSSQGTVVTGYGPAGTKNASGAAALGGLPTDQGAPVTHAQITSGTIPSASGTPIPVAEQIWP
ncbi:RHS repeat domain-containing protein [Sorangium cellulosum]|uniref:RHS protein conserved region domain-containing protein n=1 Tax=Sorangium cellulosum TaxID=56 RepID=A0A150QTD6_SORCE|nr:hypothetical protein BE15_26285 [Sorangium cellulosum]